MVVAWVLAVPAKGRGMIMNGNETSFGGCFLLLLLLLFLLPNKWKKSGENGWDGEIMPWGVGPPIPPFHNLDLVG
jgi:hypothetical protein